MSINVGHRVVIDDGDPRIQWGGNWFVWRDVGDIDILGPPFLNAMHGFMSSGSNLSFSYHGNDFSIIGAVAPLSTSLISWTCFVDGQQTGQRRLDRGSIGYLLLCDGRSLPGGNHTVQTTFIDGSGSLWVDSIQYSIASTANIGDEWEQVAALDTRIQYPSGSWYELPQGDAKFKWTNSNGGSLTYDFIGEAVLWQGFVVNNPALGPGLGHYTLDGKQPPTPFTIRAPGNYDWRNQVLFNISGLKPGKHRLEVVNDGNLTTAPLGLSFIVTKTSRPGEAEGKGGKIIGGAVGGSLGVVLIILVLIVIYIRRQCRRRRHQSEELGVAMDGPANTSGKMTERSQTPGSQAPGTHPVSPSQPPLSSVPGPRAINTGRPSPNAEQTPVQREQDGKVEVFEYNPWR